MAVRALRGATTLDEDTADQMHLRVKALVATLFERNGLGPDDVISVFLTATPDVERNRAMLTQLLMSDQPPTENDPKETTTADNELLVLARRYGVERENALPIGEGRGEDVSNPVIAINHDACILCDRCVRACDDIQGNDVIGRSGKGYSTLIAFDLNDPMGESSCVTCGECVAACPTGAGSSTRHAARRWDSYRPARF